MNESDVRRNRLATWYEGVRWPGLVLAGLVAVLYGPFVGGGFLLDDHRVMRLLGDYEAGRRSTPGLYRFLSGDEDNRRQRVEGWYPWWLSDDVRYRHLRPAAEYVILCQYRLFGDRPIAYRLAGIALYAAGVRIVLALFRFLSPDERRARWGALIFAVAASHAVPVMFLSAQGDLFGVILIAAAAIACGRFVRDGAVLGLLAAALFYGAALGFKEAALPACAMPACLWLAFRERPNAGRRALAGTVILSVIGLVWLAAYMRGGYGSNALPMLDPAAEPVAYLLALPWRSVLLLSTWLVSFNPFLFYFYPAWRPGVFVSLTLGAIGLMLVGRMFWRRHRRDGSVQAMACWVAPFLPLLVCTVPDDRIMTLPRIGLTYLAAVWLTRPGSARPGRLLRLPLFLFIWFQIPGVLIVGTVLRYIERDSAALVRAAADEFDRPIEDGDHVFFLNARRSHHVLFGQDCFQAVIGSDALRVSYLSDVSDPKVTRVDERTLRIEAGDGPLLGSFLGDMGRSRDRPRRPGDEYPAGPFIGRIVDCDGDDVRVVELRFEHPLASDSYRFYWRDPGGALVRRFAGP